MDMKESIFIYRLNKIRHYNETLENFLNKDLYKLLIREESLVAGYEKIKNNKDASTPATTLESLDGFNRSRILKLRSLLQNESWKPKPARRIYIPNPGKVEKPLYGIADLEEKVVQAVVRLILESIYIPIFSPNSYGFRPGKGTHDALKFIHQNYGGVVWALEGDIKGMYDNVNHHILIKLLEKRIKDDRFIRLIWKLLGAGYMDGEKDIPPFGRCSMRGCRGAHRAPTPAGRFSGFIGALTEHQGPIGAPRAPTPTPQGSIVEPCLANIYLHELDEFMEDLCKDKAMQPSPNRHTTFKEVESEKEKVTGKYNKPGSAEERQMYTQKYRGLQNESLSITGYTKGNHRILYTRYADDFIVGIAVSKAYAIEIKEQVETYISRFMLKLNTQRWKIIPLTKEYAFFLGHRININTSVKIKRVTMKGKTPFTTRVTGKFVSISAPMDNLISRLCEKGFCDQKGKPKHKTSWITRGDHQIIDLFNYSIREVFGFYSGVDKKHALSRIWYIFKFSCALTLAARHSSSLPKIFEKHGAKLKVIYGQKGEKQTCLYQPDLKNSGRVWQTGKFLQDPFKYIPVTRVYSQSSWSSSIPKTNPPM